MKEPTLREVNQEIKRMEKLLRGNQHTLQGLKFLCATLDLTEFENTVRDQKKVIESLYEIRGKLY